MQTKIKKLSLTNFRNHQSFKFESDASVISIIGQNGSGKTNILEAISLLSPISKGIRGAKISEFQKFEVPSEASQEGLQDSNFVQPWTVFSEIETDDDEISLGVSFEKESAEKKTEKKIYNLNGDKLKKPAQEIPQYFSYVSLVPTQDHTFSSGSTSRRDFLDRLASVFFYDYQTILNNFESLKSQRRRLLYSYPIDDFWISSLEEQMASAAVIVASYRNEVIDLLNKNINAAEMSEFPAAIVSVKGEIENNLLEMKGLEVEQEYAVKLKNERQQDKESNRTNSGIHRSDFVALHGIKKMPAEICSMGEQKAVLLSIILSTILAKKSFSGRTPLLLLDEVAAHLDEVKRGRLYEFIKNVDCQTWLTSTEKEHFLGLDSEIIQL